MANVSLTVGSKVSFCGKVGPRNMFSVWGWTVIILDETEKAYKFGVPGSKLYMWMPKSCIKDNVELTDFGVKLIRQSYIARQSCDGELINHLGFGALRRAS